MGSSIKRNYTAMEYRSIIRRLRAARPDISISSDFIIGFPGETDADFEATEQACVVGFILNFAIQRVRFRCCIARRVDSWRSAERVDFQT